MAIGLLPALVGGGRMAMQYLPLITGGFSALEGLKTGGIPGALASGTIGYLGGKAGAGPLRGLRGEAAKAAPGLASLAGIEGTPKAAQAVGRAAVPLAAAALAAPLAGRLAGSLGGGVTNLLTAPLTGALGAAGNLAQSGAGILGYRPDGSPIYGGQAVPGGMGQYGPTDPYGSPLDVLGPTGMGRRLETLKSAEAQRDAMRTLLPEVYKATEATKKSDFERQAAMKGIAQNIQTRAAMLQAAQQAGLQMGGTAAQQAGQALTQLYQYS
jgi:hypothetical protein